MNVPERIHALRMQMQAHHYDMYIIPTDDNHQSEYVGEHFKCRDFITGFTGSSGTAVINMTSAALFTDGRYFLQAENQLARTGVDLYKMGEPGVPTIEEYIEKELPENGILGFDGRVMSMENGNNFEEIVLKKNGSIKSSHDLIDLIWNERPPLSTEPAFALDDCYCGETTASKLARVRKKMSEAGADVHILASLDDICWITNLRGNDIAYSPLLLSYASITMEQMTLYVDEQKLSPALMAKLEENDITICPYNAIYHDLTKLPSGSNVMLDSARINYALYHSLPEGADIIKKCNPSVFMKAVKNDVEIQNIKNTHLKDGVAVTRFMYWLKHAVSNGTITQITEISAAEKLEALRKEQDGYLWQSFAPICGFGEHGAIIHYSATNETNAPFSTGNLLLTDTGGGYLEGSTDITRTFALGDIPSYMKEDFTTVLISNLRLANAVFLRGACGANLDILARMPLWERGKNYRHGTGHGVGYLMNIHEAPCSIHTKIHEGTKTPLEPGMIITDEPGIYVEGSHGIRIENELLVRNGEENEYGQFLHFEPITYVPIDLDAVLPDKMTTKERRLLNAYHAKVYKKIAPHLNDEEREWLKKYTREI